MSVEGFSMDAKIGQSQLAYQDVDDLLGYQIWNAKKEKSLGLELTLWFGWTGIGLIIGLALALNAHLDMKKYEVCRQALNNDPQYQKVLGCFAEHIKILRDPFVMRYNKEMIKDHNEAAVVLYGCYKAGKAGDSSFMANAMKEDGVTKQRYTLNYREYYSECLTIPQYKQSISEGCTKFKEAMGQESTAHISTDQIEGYALDQKIGKNSNLTYKDVDHVLDYQIWDAKESRSFALWMALGLGWTGIGLIFGLIAAAACHLSMKKYQVCRKALSDDPTYRKALECFVKIVGIKFSDNSELESYNETALILYDCHKANKCGDEEFMTRAINPISESFERGVSFSSREQYYSERKHRELIEKSCNQLNQQSA